MAKKKKVEDLPLVSFKQLSKPVGQLAEEAYISYGYYVNAHRHMANVYDGCKDVYRRLIYTASRFPKDKQIGTGEFIAAIQSIHPHGYANLDSTAASMVRSGIFSGEGAFGYTSIDGTVNPNAAPRYTATWLSKEYREILGDLISEVPYIASPVGAPEPTFLPVPLPLCLYMSDIVIGLGVGISTQYPNFSPQSLYKAWKENNPNLLEPRVNLLLDKANSELAKLWTTGKGRVIYSYKITREVSNDGKTEGILFQGDTGIFTPKLKKLSKLAEEGKIFIDDLTDFEGPKLFIGRVPGVKGFSIDDLEGVCRKICFDATTYNLNITDGQSAFRIPLRDWLDTTLNNYRNLVIEVNKKKIEQVKFQIKVNEALPSIAEYIMNVNPKASDEDIVKALGIELEVVESVMEKPISWLRKNKDTSERVKRLKEKLKELKSFDAIKYIEDIIEKL